jgi:hypothetical protein
VYEADVLSNTFRVMGNLGMALGAGAGAIVFIIVIYVVMVAIGLVVGAWLMSLYIRLIIRFLRKTLDREYRYMRGDYFTDQRPSADRPPSRARGW